MRFTIDQFSSKKLHLNQINGHFLPYEQNGFYILKGNSKRIFKEKF